MVQTAHKGKNLMKSTPATIVIVSLVFAVFLPCCLSQESKVIIAGDSRRGGDAEADAVGDVIRSWIVQSVINNKPEAFFHLGDFVESGDSAREWELFYKDFGAVFFAGVPFHVVFGNHEYKGNREVSERMLRKNFPQITTPWYTVNHDDVCFLILDSNQPFMPGSEQYEFICETLDNAAEKSMVVPLVHHPVFTCGNHNGATEARARQHLHPLFSKHSDKIRLVFSGHNHGYERLQVDGITYVVSGGAGSPLYDVDQNTRNVIKAKSIYNYCDLTIKGSSTIVRVWSHSGKPKAKAELFDTFTVSTKK